MAINFTPSELRSFFVEWINALRSGEYVQGQRYLERLRNGEKSRFCCLGVACHLLTKKGLLTRFVGGDYPHCAFYGTTEVLSNSTVFPEEVFEALGLGPHGESDKAPGIPDLAYANDAGRSFDCIADLLERYLEFNLLEGQDAR